MFNPQFLRLKRILTGELARSGYISAADQSIISLANFIGAIIVARNTSLTAFGVYGVGFTALRLGRTIQEGLIIQPFNTYSHGGGFQEFRRYASTSLVLQVALAFLTSVGAALLGYLLVVTGNDVVGPMVFGLWFSLFTTQLQEFLRRIFYIREQTGLALLNSIVTNVVRMAVLLSMAQKGMETGLDGLNAIAWGSLAGILLGLWNGRSYWTRNLLRLREVAIRDLQFGRWILGGLLANFVAVEFYPVMTAGMISFAASGAYRAIQNLLAPVPTVLRAMDTFLAPRMAKLHSSLGMRSLNPLLKKIYLLVGAPVVVWLVFVSIFAGPLLRILYGDQYVAFASGVPLMAVFYFLWFLYWPVYIAIKAARISRPIFVANALAIGLMFTVGILMIQKWGVYGTLSGQILNALVVAGILWRAWLIALKKDTDDSSSVLADERRGTGA